MSLRASCYTVRDARLIRSSYRVEGLYFQPGGKRFSCEYVADLPVLQSLLMKRITYSLQLLDPTGKHRPYLSVKSSQPTSENWSAVVASNLEGLQPISDQSPKAVILEVRGFDVPNIIETDALAVQFRRLLSPQLRRKLDSDINTLDGQDFTHCRPVQFLQLVDYFSWTEIRSHRSGYRQS
jgi:hypothetical protein